MDEKTADDLIREELRRQRLSGVTAGFRSAGGSKRGARRHVPVRFDLPWEKKSQPASDVEVPPVVSSAQHSVVVADKDGSQEVHAPAHRSKD